MRPVQATGPVFAVSLAVWLLLPSWWSLVPPSQAATERTSSQGPAGSIVDAPSGAPEDPPGAGAAESGAGSATDAGPVLEVLTPGVYVASASAPLWSLVDGSRPLRPGDRVRTDEHGVARLAYDVAAALELYPASGLLVQHWDRAEDGRTLASAHLGVGTAVARQDAAAESAVRLALETPALSIVLAGARTVWLQVQPNGTTRVGHAEQVAATPLAVQAAAAAGDVWWLPTGQELELAPNRPPSPPVAIRDRAPMAVQGPALPGGELAARLAAARTGWLQRQSAVAPPAGNVTPLLGAPPLPRNLADPPTARSAPPSGNASAGSGNAAGSATSPGSPQPGSSGAGSGAAAVPSDVRGNTPPAADAKVSVPATLVPTPLPKPSPTPSPTTVPPTKAPLQSTVRVAADGTEGPAGFYYTEAVRQARGMRAVGNMTYHGGQVMRATSTNYVVYWQPAGWFMSANYRTLINRYFLDVGGTTYYNILTQYADGGGAIANSSSLGGAYTDTTPFPATTLFRQDLQNAVSRALAANPTWQAGINSVFYVVLPQGAKDCFDNTSCSVLVTNQGAYCAYHSYYTRNGQSVQFASIPYTANVAGCDSGNRPNGDHADAVLTAVAHEHFEAVTDPQLDAWYFQNLSGEISDLCNQRYGNVDPGTQANVFLNGHPYVLQQQWSNATGSCVLAYGNAPPPLANDSFANAVAVGGLPAHFTVSTTAATTEAGEPTVCGTAPIGKTVWYRYTPAANTTLTIKTVGSGFDTVLGVYTGGAVNALTAVACNDDIVQGTQQSQVQFAATAGATYRIQVGGYTGASGDVVLDISASVGNDAFAGAVPVVTLPAHFTADTSLAGTEAGEPATCGTSPIGKTLWYYYTPAVASNVVVRTAGSNFDTVLGVYTGTTVGGLTAVVCNDDSGGAGYYDSVVQFLGAANTTYLIQAGGYGTSAGSLVLDVTGAPAAANDRFGSSQLLAALPAHVTATNTGTQTEGGEPTSLPCGTTVPVGTTLWYTYIPPVTQQVTLQTLGSSFDTVLAVYTGSAVNALTAIVCNDDVGGTRQSQVNFTALGGVPYRIQVGGYAGATGNLVLDGSSVMPAACATNRPSVAVTSTAANGALYVTVAAVNGPGVPGNSLTSLRFGEPRASFNALVDIGGQQGRTGSFQVPIDAGVPAVTFAVRRAEPGPATAYFIVLDACGGWATFAGGGVGAGF